MWCNMASKPMGRSATGATIVTVHAPFSSYTTLSKGRLPAVKQQIVDMTLNGSGVRDIVRVLGVSSATVIDVLKKKEPAVKQVNERLLKYLDPAQLDVIIRQVEDAEMDEMSDFCRQQKATAMVMACDRPSYRPGLSLCVWSTRG